MTECAHVYHRLVPPDRADLQQLKNIARRAMLARGLLPDFSAVALEQAGTLRQAPIETGPSIHDLRGLLWASIDNDDSLDLDQLSVAEPLSAGAVKILVAIADVDSAVKAGSAIDEHARINTTSVYTAAQVFPMLPDQPPHHARRADLHGRWRHSLLRDEHARGRATHVDVRTQQCDPALRPSTG